MRNYLPFRIAGGKFGIPVCMMTDCKAGVLGEYYFGGAKEAKTLVYLIFSTGIGAGVLER